MNLKDILIKNKINPPEFSHSITQEESGALVFWMKSSPKVALADWNMPLILEKADDLETAEVIVSDIREALAKQAKPEKKGKIVMAGDEIFAGIDEDDAMYIPNALVLRFESGEDMKSAMDKMEWDLGE